MIIGAKVISMSKPIAVLISDVHYSIVNLQLADAAMRQAIHKANDLDVPLIVAGDLHDTKANLRGECVNAMIETFKLCTEDVFILVGNHDRINEKSKEHSLNFLEGYARIVTSPLYNKIGWFIPYNHNIECLKADISGIRAQLGYNKTLIMHQGIQGSNMGDYIQDKSALSPADVAGFRIISGHYHARQTIALPDGGKWDYIGNPYTVSYGEANDPPKGFQILMEDGSLEFVPTNLRAHRVWHMNSDVHCDMCEYNPGDLLWIKLHGTKEALSILNKHIIAARIGIQDFRLDLIPDETTSQLLTTTKISSSDLLDGLIDSLTNTSEERKTRLKANWKNLCE